MADENNDLNTEEIQETSVPEETAAEEPAAETENQTEGNKTHGGGFGKVVFVLFVLMIAGAAGVPQTRNMIIEKFKLMRETVQSSDRKDASEDGEAAKTETKKEISEEFAKRVDKHWAMLVEADEPGETEVKQLESRLEQLENAREFENADVVIASAEPEVAAAPDPAYTVLTGRQNALLAEVERLRRQLDQVRESTGSAIDGLKDELPNERRIDERIDAVHAREDGLEQQIVQESQKISRLEKSKADASAVLSLMARMDAAEQKLRIVGVERERSVALLLAAYQLREAAFSGNAFETELRSMAALTESASGIGRSVRSLSAFAAHGVMTKQALIRAFDVYADQAVQAEDLSPKKDWFHQAVNTLKKLVVIRKTQPTGEEPSTQNVLARAGIAVRDGDLSDAVSILSGLRGAASDVMRAWTQKTENYLFVKKTIDETVSSVLGIVYADRLKGE